MVTQSLRSRKVYKPQLPTFEEEEEKEILHLANILLKLAKSKRRRHRTSPEQLMLLEKTFKVQHTPDLETRLRLAEELDMTPRRIQIWFQNKRAKVKKVRKTMAYNQFSADTAEGNYEDEVPSSPPSPKFNAITDVAVWCK